MARWLILGVGILFEVGAATSMKLAEGFTRLLPSILAFACWAGGITVFIVALDRFDLSFAYAIWAGLGILAVSVVGIVYLGEPISPLKVASMIVIAIGVVGLNLSDVGQ